MWVFIASQSTRSPCFIREICCFGYWTTFGWDFSFSHTLQGHISDFIEDNLNDSVINVGLQKHRETSLWLSALSLFVQNLCRFYWLNFVKWYQFSWSSRKHRFMIGELELKKKNSSSRLMCGGSNFQRTGNPSLPQHHLTHRECVRQTQEIQTGGGCRRPDPGRPDALGSFLSSLAHFHSWQLFFFS